MTRSSRIPTGRLLDNMGASVLSGDSMRPVTTDIKYVSSDYDFASTFGIRVTAGRFFSREYGTDTASFVINESAVKAVGWKNAADAVDKNFKYGNQSGHIVGVINDFHLNPCTRLLFLLYLLCSLLPKTILINLTVKISGSNIAPALAYMEKTWKKILS
ncbi:MAG: hypothetical protein WDO71_01250 [Bacteroidota bacterium]